MVPILDPISLARTFRIVAAGAHLVNLIKEDRIGKILAIKNLSHFPIQGAHFFSPSLTLSSMSSIPSARNVKVYHTQFENGGQTEGSQSLMIQIIIIMELVILGFHSFYCFLASIVAIKTFAFSLIVSLQAVFFLSGCFKDLFFFGVLNFMTDLRMTF